MELTPELIIKLNKDQMELLKELGELAKKEAELTKIIDDNRRMAEKVGLGRDREEAKSIMDDHEFDSLLSVQSVYEREQIKTKIRSVIQSLQNSGLGDLDLIKRQAKNYGLTE
jgi:hypothetical protein